MFLSPFLPVHKTIYWKLKGWLHRQMENKLCGMPFVIKRKTVQRPWRFWQSEFFPRAVMLSCVNFAIADEPSE